MSEPQQAAAPTIEQLVAAEQVRGLFSTIKFTATIAPPASLALLSLLWPAVDHQNAILWWLLLFLTLTPVSLGFLHYFQRNNHLPHDSDYWLRIFLIRQMFTYTSHTACFLLWVPHSLQHQIILVCFLVAVTAMIVQDTAYHRTVYLVSLPLCLVPTIILACLEGAFALAIITTGMLLFLLGSARNLNRLLLDALRLRFVNEELAKQLQTEKTISEEANRAKSRFLAAASHDLRQPMHALGLYATAVRPFVAAEQGQQVVDKIESSVAATETLFNALLDVSRLDAGIVKPEIRPIAVGDLLNRLAVEYAPLAAEKGLTLGVRTRAYTVMSDASLLERILRNYLSNAIRYTQHGGIVAGCRKRGDRLSIEVWDTGCGIPAERLADIYQEFYQIGNPERDRAKGLGLGLAIVKRTAELLAHPITVRSVPGRGSMFSVLAPLTSAAALPVHDSEESPVDESQFIGATVLVIDDEQDVLNAMSLLLEQWGCAVVVAESGAQALTALRQLEHAPDAILSDYRLRDGETGIAAIQAIHLEWGNTPAALITGDTAPDRLVEATRGGYALLHKPIGPEQFKRVLYSLLTEKQRNSTEISS